MDTGKPVITIAVSLPELADDADTRSALRARIKAAIQDAAAAAVEDDVEVIVELRATDD